MACCPSFWASWSGESPSWLGKVSALWPLGWWIKKRQRWTKPRRTARWRRVSLGWSSAARKRDQGMKMVWCASRGEQHEVHGGVKLNYNLSHTYKIVDQPVCHVASPHLHHTSFLGHNSSNLSIKSKCSTAALWTQYRCTYHLLHTVCTECKTEANGADEGLNYSGSHEICSISIILLPRKTGCFTEPTPAPKPLLPFASCAAEHTGA